MAPCNGCALCRTPGTVADPLNFSLQCADRFVPRFAWRVGTYDDFATISWSASPEVVREAISQHLRWRSYGGPRLISLTGSLLWALNFVHYKRRKDQQRVTLFLIDTRKIARDRVFPAWALVEYCRLPKLEIPWHDEPWHEYLVQGPIPDEAILGSINIGKRLGPWVDQLLPGFNTVYPGERLLTSLTRLQCQTKVAISSHCVDVALGFARSFQFSSPEIQFAVFIMFLALRPRNWGADVMSLIVAPLNGRVDFPSDYLYRSRVSAIPPGMPDVVELVRGMTYCQLEGEIAKIIGSSSSRPQAKVELIYHLSK